MFGSSGQRVKVNFGTLCIRLCGHDTDYSFAQSLSKFTCKLWMMRGGNPIDFGSRGQRSRLTLTLCVGPCGHDTDYSFSPITLNFNVSCG